MTPPTPTPLERYLSDFPTRNVIRSGEFSVVSVPLKHLTHVLIYESVELDLMHAIGDVNKPEMPVAFRMKVDTPLPVGFEVDAKGPLRETELLKYIDVLGEVGCKWSLNALPKRNKGVTTVAKWRICFETAVDAVRFRLTCP